MTELGHPVTVTGLILDAAGRMLVLRPATVDHAWWFLPGSPLPFNHDPIEGLRTALREQLNVRLAIGPLHLTAYRQPADEHDVGEFVLLFDCGTHESEALAAAGMWPGRTVQIYRWASPAEAAIDLEPHEWQRVQRALQHPRSGAFLEQLYYHAHHEPGGADDADDVSGRPYASTGPERR
jgi:ADP-ribose pyrophosphatase YjhB (NUDIX family)